jgi:hypothetical protein
MRQRIQTVFLITTALFVSYFAIADESHSQLAPIIPSGKKLGTIFNNDINNILLQAGLKGGQVADYQRYLDQLLAMKPKVLAQNIGLPDPVIYRSDVATTLDKYVVEISKVAWPENDPEKDSIPQEKCLLNLFAAGTDPLKLTIDACRRNGVLVVASYRMNAEDWYQNTWRLSDFGREHPDYRIAAQKDTPGWGKPLTGNLDPAIPDVYEHRMKIFREVAEKYDIDGIEFDFRRWYHMVSDPEKNHVVLTRMVRDTRAMLDEVAKRKGRNKLLLGVRVAASLDSPPDVFLHPGAWHAENLEYSCKYYGLDVPTWTKEELVDYICPSQFLGQLPCMPLTREFVTLTKNTNIGVYPTLWSMASWMHEIIGVEKDISLEVKDRPALALYKYDLCASALRMYQDGADGISTFNWYAHLVDSDSTWPAGGAGAVAVQKYVLPFLNDPAAIRKYLDQPWATPPQ